MLSFINKQLDSGFKDIILRNACDRPIGIYGINRNTKTAERILHSMGKSNYAYFGDTKYVERKRKGRVILPFHSITKDYYILVADTDIQAVGFGLEHQGMNHIHDWCYLPEYEFYSDLQKNINAPFVPNISDSDIRLIEKELADIVMVEYLPPYDSERFDEFEHKTAFSDFYRKDVNKRYKRKMLEYYYTFQLLHLSERSSNSVYIDVGACGSPFVKWLRQTTDVQAYAIDLEEGPYKDLSYYMCQDATNMRFDDASVDAISIQSAFEMFIGDNDIKAIKEFSRVLKPGGEVIILPLYMHTQFLSTVSPKYYGTGTADEGALECIRTDCWNWVPLGRFYDVDALENRVLKTAEDCGMTPKVYSLSNDSIEKDGFVYLKFILSLKKQ